jgi:hypothetical protein
LGTRSMRSLIDRACVDALDARADANGMVTT